MAMPSHEPISVTWGPFLLPSKPPGASRVPITLGWERSFCQLQMFWNEISDICDIWTPFAKVLTKKWPEGTRGLCDRKGPWLILFAQISFMEENQQKYVGLDRRTCSPKPMLFNQNLENLVLSDFHREAKLHFAKLAPTES